MKQQPDPSLGASVGERVISYTTAQALGLEWAELRDDRRHHPVRVIIREVWIRQDLGEWRAMLRIVPSKNQNPVVAEIRIFPKESDADHRAAGLRLAEWSGCYLGDKAVVPGSGLTARQVKAVKIGEAVRKGVGIIRQKFTTSPTGGALLGFWPGRPASRAKHGGRRRIPDEVLVRVAATYAAHFGAANPVQVTATTCRITRTQARDWLHIARERGLLCQADSTRPLGELTIKGQRVLEASQAKAATRAVHTKGGRPR